MELNGKEKEMSNEEKYFIDERVGCMAIRDREYTNPTYPGLHPDTKGVVRYYQGVKINITCPQCGHHLLDKWVIPTEVREEAVAYCKRLNDETKLRRKNV